MSPWALAVLLLAQAPGEPAQESEPGALEAPAAAPVESRADQPSPDATAGAASPDASAEPAPTLPIRPPPEEVGPQPLVTGITLRGEQLSGRDGLYGWGLALELPLFGLGYAVANSSELGMVPHLGAAVSWEIWPSWLVRGQARWYRTYGSRSTIHYLSAGSPATVEQESRWKAMELTAGGSYLWRSADRFWTPFAGLEAGLRLGGFELVVQETTNILDESDPALGALDAEHILQPERGGYGWVVATRGGVQLAWSTWFATLVELSASYTQVPSSRLPHTLGGPEPRTAAEGIWVMRASFGMRFGL